MEKQQNPRPTIGIVGGGQLGRMLTEAALPLGFDVVVVDPTENCPAHQAGASEITADLYDQLALQKLAERADYLTVEIEHLDSSVLESLEEMGAVINPRPATIRLIQDKYAQKVFLRKQSIPVADFVDLPSIDTAKKALQMYDGKMLIKTKHGAYDGRGNLVIESIADIEHAFDVFAGKSLYGERFVSFERELAVIAARDQTGAIAVYPTVQTIHARSICEEVLSPAPVPATIRGQAEKLAREVVSHLQGAGVYAIEMFLTPDGSILINEIAPRVHNSGHHTIEGNRTSQFEQHIRAISGLPLGDVSPTAPATVMVNILGERNGPTRLTGLATALAIPETHVHLYGKSPTKIDRKMGHITVTANTLKTARQRARAARKGLQI